MLVKCDKCGQEYDVNEERIAPQGVRIKCPSCAHIFLVRRPDAKTLSGLIGLGDLGAGADEEVTWRVRHIGLTYTFHDLDSLRDWLSGRNSLQDVKIARGEDDWRELGDYPDVMTTELITRFFPLGDVPTSRSVEEEDTSGVKPKDADFANDFMSLEDLRSASTTGIAMAAPASVSANLSKAEKSSSMKAKRKKQQKAAADTSDAGKRVVRKKLIVLFILFTILAVNIVFVVRFMKYGSFFVPDIPEYYDNDDEDLIDPATLEAYANGEDGDASATPAEDKPTEPVLSDEEKARIAEEQHLKEIEEDKRHQLDDAAQMVKNRKWPEARAILESYRAEWPEDIEALQLLSKTYRGLELGDKAAEVDAQIKKLKAAAKAAEEKAKAEAKAAEEKAKAEAKAAEDKAKADAKAESQPKEKTKKK